MPEFLPTPVMPQGLAEETLRLAAARGEASPWAALARAAGTVGQGVAAKRMASGPVLTPEQAQAMGIQTSVPAPMPTGAQGPGQPVNAFPRGVPMTLAENMLQRKTQQDIARETTARMMGTQGLRNEEADKKNAPIPVTDMHKEQYKKVYGHDIPFDHITPAQEKQLATEFAAKSKPGPTPKTLTPAQIDAEAAKFNDALDPEKKRSGSFGLASQKFNRAEGLESLASAFPDGNLDSRQIEELAIGLNSLLSGANTGAEAQVKALVPKTALGDANKLKEWLSNNPTGTGQQAFVKRLLGTITREKNTAAEQIKREQLSVSPGFARMEKENPDTFFGVLEGRGISKDEYLKWKKGGRKRLSAVQRPEGAGDSASLDGILAKHGVQ